MVVLESSENVEEQNKKNENNFPQSHYLVSTINTFVLILSILFQVHLCVPVFFFFWPVFTQFYICHYY